MKRSIQLLCGAGTALSILLGFSLPGIGSALEDRQLMSQTSVYETEPVLFHSARQITDTFSLLSQKCGTMELQPAYARMNQEQVIAAWRDFFRRMTDRRLFSGDAAQLISTSAVPMLYFINSGREDAAEAASPFSSKVSAVIWNCAVTGPDGSAAQVLIDDATGLVLSVSYWQGNMAESLSTVEKQTALRAFSAGCADLFAGYYGIETGEVEYGSYPDSAAISIQAENGNTYLMELTLQGASFSLWTE